MTTLFDGEIFADYFQIYLSDEGQTEFPEDYDEDSIARRLTIAPYAVIFHTARDMEVSVVVEWHEHKPELNADKSHHIVEGGFTSLSGTILIAGITDEEASARRMQVKPGALAVRVCMNCLDTLSEDELEGDDRYLVQLWATPSVPALRVLKTWTSVAPA